MSIKLYICSNDPSLTKVYVDLFLQNIYVRLIEKDSDNHYNILVNTSYGELIVDLYDKYEATTYDNESFFLEVIDTDSSISSLFSLLSKIENNHNVYGSILSSGETFYITRLVCEHLDSSIGTYILERLVSKVLDNTAILKEY